SLTATNLHFPMAIRGTLNLPRSRAPFLSHQHRVVPSADTRSSRCQPGAESAFGPALAADRSASRRSGSRALRSAEPAERFLYRIRQRRCLAVYRLRLDVAAPLR